MELDTIMDEFKKEQDRRIRIGILGGFPLETVHSDKKQVPKSEDYNPAVQVYSPQNADPGIKRKMRLNGSYRVN